MHEFHSASDTWRVIFNGRGNVRVEPPSGSAQLARRYHMALRDQSLARAFGERVPTPLADLEDVAAAIYCADHLIPGKVGPAAITRLSRPHIDIELPVREPDRWDDPVLSCQLRDVLWEFTGLEFSFTFTKLREEFRRPSEMQWSLPGSTNEGPMVLALDSGGLDSLLGLLIRLEQEPHDRFMLVSVATSFRKTSMRRRLLEELWKSIGRDRLLGRVNFGLRIGRLEPGPVQYEHTARTRGFLFLALGAVAALVAGVPSLANFENGVGAISLPYNRGQRRFDNSRAVHPRALMEMGKLVRLITGTDFTFPSTFLYWTKGQMCAAVDHPELGKLIDLTNSCDNFPQRRPANLGQDHCGACSSCLLRRLSLDAAGMRNAERTDRYVHDILLGTASEPDRWNEYDNMVLQAKRLESIAGCPDPVSRLFAEFPELKDVVIVECAQGADEAAVRSQLGRLHFRNSTEVLRFDQQVPT